MKKINNVVATILLIIGLYYLIKFSISKEITRILVSLCVPILVVLPKFFKNKINDKLVFIYYIYVFLLLVLGCLTKLYSRLVYYDVFTHFMFGFIGCIAALYLLNLFDMQYKNKIFNIIFMISLTLAFASIWEIFEYISSIVFNDDVQHVLTTGVRDTMEDIISSLVASIIFVITYIFKKDKIDTLVEN